MVERKRNVTPRLTVPLHVPVSPELKEAVDRAALSENIATNEWVARVLAKALGRKDLAKIPRKPMGRPRGVERLASV